MFNILTTQAQRQFKNLFVNNFKTGLEDENEELLAWQFIRDGGNLDIKNRQNKPLIFYCCEKGFSSILKFFIDTHKLKPKASYIVYIDELYDVSVSQTPNIYITPAQTFHKYYSLNLLEYACFYGQNKIIDCLQKSNYFHIKNTLEAKDIHHFNHSKQEHFDGIFLALYNQHFNTANYLLGFLSSHEIEQLFQKKYYHQHFLSKEANDFVIAIEEKTQLEKQFLNMPKSEVKEKKKTYKI
jgi:hypothetical protein